VKNNGETMENLHNYTFLLPIGRAFFHLRAYRNKPDDFVPYRGEIIFLPTSLFEDLKFPCMPKVL